ncbi:Long-chain-fatty-acid--CoA ligase 2 [Choanephora cucurbitarum]|uniref:Long-chain-fatty-acid--CoA ligase 2 n=1 Tax=Choanephora cucurbitarum TaxID=101091 RepID=A0A1C7N6E6_9FUNG|nr:Long-chain-fatty-acid--CoA ligase 2 [Choanephora cucurbitarum]
MAQNLFSIPVTEALAGEGPVYRSILSPSKLMTTPAEGVETLYDVLQYAAIQFPDRHAFGYRELLDTISKTKKVTKTVNGKEITEDKTWTYFKLSHYHYYSYAQAAEKTKAIGAGLVQLGLRKHSRVQVSASTSVEWMLMAHEMLTTWISQAMTIVTAYDTLGPEGLQHSIVESEASLCFVNHDQLAALSSIISACPTINAIVYRGKADPDHLTKLRQQGQIKHIMSFEELETLGHQHPIQVVKPQSDELCCIMYTSGSTGQPKGVMLTHGNVVSAIAGVCRMLQHLLEANDTILAYLPLAHVLEFLVENLCIFLGVTLGYGSVRTLTDASVRDCKGDLQEFAPSIMTGVPQVWETIRKTVLSKVAERGPRIQKVFMGAVGLKRYLRQYGLPTTALDRVIFKNVNQQLGGRLRYCLSGGAPVSAETQDFLSLTVCPILAGYGMTESMCAIMAPEQWALTEVGAPVPCVEVKLVDQPELGYLSSNPSPQGEIWIRGPSITLGYYKRDDITKETLEDGWLKTGDIGEWTHRGTLKIIDRVKNLVKLSHGEYIALEKLESVYKSHVMIENMCVYADPLYPKPVGLLVPLEAPLRQLVDDSSTDWETLCHDTKVRQIVLKEMQEQARRAGLKGSEIIADVWLSPEIWTPEMGLMTAAQKLKRNEINKRYEKELKEM